jgi:hypothetical protein
VPVEKRSPNELNAPVPKFCLTLEDFRRTPDGRVRPAPEFLQHFFPHGPSGSTDRIFKFLPNEVRGPVLTAWGLRGAKSALKDTDDKVQAVVYDALIAGDIDHDAFEQALGPDIVVRWAPLAEWWSFWRAGKLSKLAIHKALESGYDLGLFDAKWFFDTIETPNGKLKGTDVVSEGLTKAELTEWVRKVHASGDGSPKGLLAAIGWDRVVGKTPNDVLVKVIDALASKIGLVGGPKVEEPEKPIIGEEVVEERPSTRMTPVPPVSANTIAENALVAAIVSPGKKGSLAPEERVDNLFADSDMPPADDDVSVEVEEEEHTEVPTNRPPADEPILLKPRASQPSIPSVSPSVVPSASPSMGPAARRR